MLPYKEGRVACIGERGQSDDSLCSAWFCTVNTQGIHSIQIRDGFWTIQVLRIFKTSMADLPYIKAYKREKFFGSDFEFFTIL